MTDLLCHQVRMLEAAASVVCTQCLRDEIADDAEALPGLIERLEQAAATARRHTGRRGGLPRRARQSDGQRAGAGGVHRRADQAPARTVGAGPDGQRQLGHRGLEEPQSPRSRLRGAGNAPFNAPV